MTTLADIRTKVRRLTGRPSVQAITDAQIDEYVNTFYLYDMPETLRLGSLKTNFTFLTEANVDQYDLSTLQITLPDGSTDSALNLIYELCPTAYVNGYQVGWFQDQAQFYGIWPKLAQTLTSITGNGTTGPYTWTLSNVPVLQNSISVSAIDNTGATVQLVDIPTNRTTGTWRIVNTLTSVTGSINYLTGAGTVTFSNAIPSGNEITITSVPYSASRPATILLYDNTLTFRPVPDRPYKVQIEAFQLPTALLSAGSSPKLKQWWQYLAYGAAKKVFQDSQDPEGLAGIIQAYKEQETLVMRRTIAQLSNQRAATIYSDGGYGPYGNFLPNRF